MEAIETGKENKKWEKLFEDWLTFSLGEVYV